MPYELNTAAGNKKFHNDYWGKLHKFLLKNIENRPFTNVWTSLSKFELKSTSRSYGRYGEFKYESAETFFSEKEKTLYDALNKYITSETDCIIELGSGWGRNILKLADRLHDTNIDFIAAELSESGRMITNLFTKNYNLNVSTAEFNWYDVDGISKIISNGNYKNVVIYSYHSIEQIHELDSTIFTNILSLDIDVKCIHIEPVAFQYKNEKSPFRNKSAHYNCNLKKCLDGLSDAGLIHIDNIDIGYFQSHTTYSGKNATLIQWKKKHS